jgi:hypothetical protein
MQLKRNAMESTLIRDIEAWQTEGGAALAPLNVSVALMSGTAAQVEWAERIEAQVASEFDRVTASFRSIATKESAEQTCRHGSDYRHGCVA